MPTTQIGNFTEKKFKEGNSLTFNGQINGEKISCHRQWICSTLRLHFYKKDKDKSSAR